MIKIILVSISLIVLFTILSKAANLIVLNLKKASLKTKTNPLLIGLALGFFTTLPEIAVGFNAIYNNIANISLGNIWGGIFLLFTLVLGLAIFFSKRIINDGKISFVLPSFIFIIFSFLLAYKGELNFLDGLIIILLYFFIIYFKFQQKSFSADEKVNKWQLFYQKIKIKLHLWKNSCRRELLLVLISVIVILITSTLIVSSTNYLLSYFNVHPFIIGLLVFSIGTNLPELSIVIHSIISKSSDLSFSYLVGSAINSVAALGVLTLFHTFSVTINLPFIILSIGTTIVLLLVALFYITQKAFDRWEGAVLLLIYFSFIFYQLINQF